MKSFTFVIPVRNDAARLDSCLRSIRQAELGDAVDIVVVDNGSDDGSGEVGTRHGARVLWRPAGRVSKLRNDGIALTVASIIAFVDADHSINRTWIVDALKSLEDATVGGVGAPYHAPADGSWVQRIYDLFRTHLSRPADAQWLGTGNLAVRREVFDAIGGFDESLEACEDVDFCSRVRHAGYRLLNNPALVSVHAGDPRTLADLFKSELWRGRDNLRVTLRSDRSWRSWMSLAVPVANLAALVVVLGGIVSRSVTILAIGTAVILGLAAIRSVLLIKSKPTAALLAQAFVVAVAYHVARGLALVWPARHRRARRSEDLPAVGSVR